MNNNPNNLREVISEPVNNPPIAISMNGEGFTYRGTIDLKMAALILQAIGIEQEKQRKIEAVKIV